MLEPETVVSVVLGALLVAGMGIFFLAPESRASRPPLRTAWAPTVEFASEVLASRSTRPRPMPQESGSRRLHQSLDLGTEALAVSAAP